jgi:hypothetical protein
MSFIVISENVGPAAGAIAAQTARIRCFPEEQLGCQ